MPRNKKIFFGIFWSGIFLLLFYFHSSHQVNPDEGIVLNGAWNLLNSRRLYFDTFSFIAPGSFYFIYGIWRIFGVSYLAAQLASLIFYFLGIFGIYRLSQEISDSEYNYFIPPIIIIATSWFWLINHNVYSTVCLIWAVYLLMRHLKSGQIRYLSAGGLAGGISALFLQQKGLAFIFFASIFYLALIYFKKSRWSIWAVLNLSFLAPLLVLLFWPPRLLYADLVIFPLSNYIVSNRVSFFLLFLFTVILIETAWVLRHEKRLEIYFLLFMQLGLLASTYVLPDFYHIFLAAFILLALAPQVIEKILRRNWLRRIIYFIPLIMIGLVMVYYFVIIMIQLSQITYPIGLISEVEKNCPGRYLYAGPFIPGLYFETRKLSVAPYDSLITGQETAQQFEAARLYLEQRRPECAVLSYPITLSRFKLPENNPVDDYIKANYQALPGYLDPHNAILYKRIEESAK